jgi:ankyrin repeat protein
VNVKDNNGKTPLIWAASSSVESARILISHGAKVNEKANDGMTAFIQAVFGVSSGKVPLAMCELLIENGADINASLTGPSASGWTALHYAVTNGDTELVKYLIRYGAFVNKATAEGSTPLFLAKQEGYTEIVTLLKKAGAQE